jgi:ABC-type sugar transport system substrate-binding protein
MAVDEVLAADTCKGLTIADRQESEWQRTKGADIVTNWLASGIKPDVVFANYDEMALGTIQALKSAGVDLGKVVVAGIDGTPDAFIAMEGGDLDIAVYQDAKGAVDAALAIIGGKECRPIPTSPSSPSRPKTSPSQISCRWVARLATSKHGRDGLARLTTCKPGRGARLASCTHGKGSPLPAR